MKIPRLKGIARKLINRLIHPVQSSLNNIEVKIDRHYQELSRHQNDLSNEILKSQGEYFRQTIEQLKNSGHIKISETEILSKIFSGAKMYLDPRDIAVAPHLILDGEWESNITQAWLTAVRKNDVVFDIGANFGYFGLLAAQQSNRQSKITLFEANPHLIKYINNTIDVNNMNGCMLSENVAIADKEGRLTLNVLKDYIGSSSLHSLEVINSFSHFRERAEVEEAIEVKATTLDDYSRNNKIDKINLIKMDIEGYEDKAYRGMRKLIQASDDVTLFVEFSEKAYEDPRSFYSQMLEDFGNVYLIDEHGNMNIQKKNDYDSVIGHPGEWVMPVFSKKRDLNREKRI